MKKPDLSFLALSIVGVVLVLLAIGSVIKAVQTGEGLDPGVASASFALLGAMVAGSLGTTAVAKNKKNNDDEE